MTDTQVRVCRHCGRNIVPTEFGTWQDEENLGYEVCDLMDEAGPSHEPEEAAAKELLRKLAKKGLA